MSLKLVAIDLDATLLRDDKTYDMDRFNNVVTELIKQGVTFVIASGNKNEKIRSYLSKDLLNKVYIAGCNGNDVEKSGEHIHANYFSRDALLQVAELIDADDDYQMVTDSLEATYSKYIYDKDKEYISLYYEDINIVQSYTELPKGEEAIKVAVLSAKNLEDSKKLTETIIAEIEGVTSVTSGGGWLDVYHEDGGKGSAIEWLQKTKGISVAETMAFGDSLNDSSMMAFADYSITMQNGDDEFKSFCNYEIGTNEEQSVIAILEEFMHSGNLDFMEQYKR